MRQTIDMIVDWIIANRKGRAFSGYSRQVNEDEVIVSMCGGTFAYHAEDGKLYGVVCATKDENTKTLWVHDILTTRKDVFQKFVERFLLVFPDYQLSGETYTGRHVYNPVRMLALVKT